MQPRTQKRFLLNMERVIQEANRTIIGRTVPTLTDEAVVPVMHLIAKLRGAYLCELFMLADECQGMGILPSPEGIGRLREMREAYEEVLAASQALEHVIDRGYLDVEEPQAS